MSIELVRSFLLKSKASKRHSFLNDLFTSMDRDRSRKIDYTEFKAGLRNLGLADLSEADFRNLFNEFDIKKVWRRLTSPVHANSSPKQVLRSQDKQTFKAWENMVIIEYQN